MRSCWGPWCGGLGGVPELGVRGRWCGGPCSVSLGVFPGLGAWGVPWTGVYGEVVL